MTVGFIIGKLTYIHNMKHNIMFIITIEMLLGFKLTDANNMTNQYDSYVKSSSLKDLIKYVCEFSVVSELSYYVYFTAHRQQNYCRK